MAMSCWLIGVGVLFGRLGKWFKVLLCITFIANWNLKCVRKLEMAPLEQQFLFLGFIVAVWFFLARSSVLGVQSIVPSLFGQGPCPLPVLAFVLRVNMSWKLACLVLWSLVGSSQSFVFVRRWFDNIFQSEWKVSFRICRDAPTLRRSVAASLNLWISESVSANPGPPSSHNTTTSTSKLLTPSGCGNRFGNRLSSPRPFSSSLLTGIHRF